MAPVTHDSSTTDRPAQDPSPQTTRLAERTKPTCRKFRVRFRKAGDLRLLSHHDLMHVFERMFRRAGLSVAVSQGFNPRPRMWFALSLALGVAGLNEILELEIADELTAEKVQQRLASQCPPGIEILSAVSIDTRKSARVRRAHYRLPLPADHEHLQGRCEEFLASESHCVERRRPHPRRVNLRPFVDELRIVDGALTMALWITPTGAARPEEIIAALGLQEWLNAGAVIERCDLEVCDEMPPGTPDVPAIQGALQEIPANEESAAVPRPTPIVSNPLSFDT